MGVDQEEYDLFIAHGRTMLPHFAAGNSQAISLAIDDFVASEFDDQGALQHIADVLPAAPMTLLESRREFEHADRERRVAERLFTCSGRDFIPGQFSESK